MRHWPMWQCLFVFVRGHFDVAVGDVRSIRFFHLSHRERMGKTTVLHLPTDSSKTFVQICLLLWEKGDYFTIVKWWMRSNLTPRTFPTDAYNVPPNIVGETCGLPPTMVNKV